MSNYLRSSRYSSPASPSAASGNAGAGSRLRRGHQSPPAVDFDISLSHATSTAPSASVSGEFGGGARVLESYNIRIGSNVCCVSSVDGVCGGLIGSGSKFCIRSTISCTVESHRKRPSETLSEGFYVLSNENEAFTTPFIASERLSEEVKTQLLQKRFQDTREVLRFFEHVRSSDNTVVGSFKELEERDHDMKVSLFAKTPSLKGKRGMRHQYEELLTGFKGLDMELLGSTVGTDSADDDTLDADSTSVSPTKWANQVSSFLQVIVNTLTEDQSTIDIVADKSAELFLQVGVPPPSFEIERLPPSLWVGLVQLIEEFEKYKAATDAKLRSVTQSSSRDDILALETRVNYNLQNLAVDSKKAIRSVEVCIDEVQGSDLDLISDSYHSIAACSRAIDNSNLRIDEAFTALASFQKSQSSASKQRLTSINVGRHTFHGYDDLSAWMEEKLPPEFPFGAFCDVYSYLQRVVSFKDSVSSSGLKDMELRSKMKMTACESIVLDSFKHPLPRIFNSGGSSESASTSNAWLPGIPTKTRWEDAESLSGAKITIKDNEEVVRSRLEAVISERLSSHEEAQSLARQLLSDTISFVTAMNRFISETHLRLENAGFGTDRSWQLVSKLVHRLFSNDCHNHRGRVSEILDASDRRVLAVGVLWAVFSTHQIMREYMRYGIENHPSIASEYVRFLVAHSALPKVEAVNNKLVKVQDSLSTLSNKLKTLEKDAKTAANKADEALKLAKNKK